MWGVDWSPYKKERLPQRITALCTAFCAYATLPLFHDTRAIVPLFQLTRFCELLFHETRLFTIPLFHDTRLFVVTFVMICFPLLSLYSSLFGIVPTVGDCVRSTLQD